MLSKIQHFWELGQTHRLVLELPTYLVHHLGRQLWFVDDEARLLWVLPLENGHKLR
jgi:hypothetical protein